MPIPVPRARAAAVLGVALTMLLSASIAEAKSIPAELRVVDSDGEIIAEQTQYTSTGDSSLKSDPQADCFGEGTGGSGDSVAVPGSTALSQLLDARAADRDVSPISVSDSFDFGLAICGIGEAVSTQQGFLYLKQNHTGAETGGDQTIVEKGDEILWFLVENFEDPLPDELELKVKPTADAGSDIKVKVFSFGDDGKRTPAAGAEVTGADGPTNAKGVTTVPADGKIVEVQATRDGAIPSNVGVVCTADLARCPAGYAETIGGTKGDDRIVGGKLAATVVAGGGDDTIDVSAGGKAPDVVKCGGGDDTVTLPEGVKIKTSGCEGAVDG